MGAKFSYRAIRLRWLKFATVAAGGGAALFTGLIAVQLTVTLKKTPKPQAILILDGNSQRVRQAVNFAQQHPALPIWISGSCSQRPELQEVFSTAQVSSRVHYDLQATDTVTHFTTLANEFTTQRIQHVYLVTSDYHMTRAKTVATMVFGSHGIAIAPVAQPSQRHPSDESWVKVIRDGLRALMWIVTGHSGARLNPRLQGETSCHDKIQHSNLKIQTSFATKGETSSKS